MRPFLIRNSVIAQDCEAGASGRSARDGTTDSRPLAAGTSLSNTPGAKRRTLKNAATSRPANAAPAAAHRIGVGSANHRRRAGICRSILCQTCAP